MRIYIKDVEKPDEYLQVINTTTTSDDVFLPNPGDTILLDYIVLNRVWTSLEKGTGRITFWVTKKSKAKLEINFIEEKKTSRKIKLETIKTEEIYPIQNSYIIPRIEESIKLGEKLYKIKNIIREGNNIFFGPEKINIIVHELRD